MIGQRFYKDDLDKAAYREAALWCDSTQHGHIEDLGLFLEVVANETDPNAELQQELDETYDWFSFYDRQMAEYQRCQRLGREFDRDVAALDQLAEEKKVRINELRDELAK